MTNTADTATSWCRERLRGLLGEPAAGDLSLSALRPLVGTWFGERAPGITADHDWLAIEVSHQLGDGTDDFPIDPPPGLATDAEWFSVGMVRILNTPVGDEVIEQQTVGLDLWWPATPQLRTLCQHPRWDTGNLLGFDCLGRAGAAAATLLTAPVVETVFATFADTPPAAAVLVGNRFEDLRLA